MKRFYKVDKSRVNNNSFGIGLSIANRIVNKYKAKIKIDSELNIPNSNSNEINTMKNESVRNNEVLNENSNSNNQVQNENTNNNLNNNQIQNGNTNNSQTTNETSKISTEQAKEIALKHVNLTTNEVIFAKVELDFDDGIQKYEVKFYNNNIEYEYDIDANTGEIVSCERE